MNKIFETIRNNPLFSGVDIDDLDKMLNCLSARCASFKQNDVIMLSGDSVKSVGLILSGSVQIIKEDRDGNITILAELASPEIFGEVFACAGIDHSPVTVLAADDAEILFIDYRKIITGCSSACPFHFRLVENMLMLIAKKNLLLNQKIEILSKRTTREKLLCFFDTQRGRSKKFTLPFSREEMAQYLCVDRSAMSSELGKMRDEGLIRFHKNEFEVL